MMPGIIRPRCTLFDMARPIEGTYVVGVLPSASATSTFFTSEPAALQLAMRIYLSREATNQIVATKELSVREPMSERNPYAGVVAANAAMPKLLRELAKFVVEKAD
jgi:ABC-type uncharacterized transport system auxiliary subunit